MKNEMYHYRECGLDNVYLVNGYTIDKDGALSIQDIDGLHRFIGERLVFLPRKLKGKEIRFMRHYLDLSQKMLGKYLGIDYQTVLRWETGKAKITKTAENYLRTIFYEFINKNARAVDIINGLSDLDNNRVENRLELSHKKDAWMNAA